MVSIINVGSGNFNSVANIVKKLGHKVELVSDYDKVSNSKIIILPGVGRFDIFMDKIRNTKIDKAILNAISNNSKVLGICVGMHCLLEKSEEGNCEGLKIIQGSVKKFQISNEQIIKIPHMGWNKVNLINDKENLIDNNQNCKFYFIHSYYAEPLKNENILGVTNYGITFASIIKKEKIYGVQFHPEKSHYYGKMLMENFLNA